MMQPLKWAPISHGTPANPEKQKEKLEKKLLHYLGRAIHDYQLIKNGDRILVCVSGGKDSMTMVTLLHKMQKRTKVQFELFALTLDQAQPGWDDVKLRAFYEENKINYEILHRDTYSIVKEKTPEGQTYCALCSRLRRGNIYGYAEQHGFNKIALGHHRDDLNASLLMSIFYNGQIGTMPPKLLSDNKRHIVIRPLTYCQEKDIAAYATLSKFPIIPCTLCGSQENLARKRTQQLLQTLAAENPKIPSNMLRALQQVKPSQLMDNSLWNFKDLEDQQGKEYAQALQD